MGQAKQRGTYEERKALAVQKHDIELAEQRRRRTELQKIADHEADMREAAMSPEERLRKRNGGVEMMALYAAIAMLGGGRKYR